MKTRMKLFLLLVVIASLVLAACSETTTDDAEEPTAEPVAAATEAPDEPEPVEAPTEEPEPVEEPAEEPEPEEVVDERYGGTFYHASHSAPGRFFPPESTSSSQWLRMQQVFGALVNWEVGTPDAVYPDLAESWDVSDDGLEYTFYLREGATFHNGREIVADDVVFSLNEFAVEGRPYSSKHANIASIESPDDYTIVITLKNPNPYFLQSIAGPTGSFVMPRDVVEELGDDYGTSPENFVGSGPFKMVEWSDTQLGFEANDDFYGGRPFVDRWIERYIPETDTRVLELRAGNVDMLYLDNPYKLEFVQDPEWQDYLHVGSHLNTWYFLMNPSIEPFDDIRVREALNWAADMDQLVEISRGGMATAANQVTIPGLVGHDDNIQYYRPSDVEKAKELLAEAGYEEGDLTIQMYVWNRQEAVQDMEFLAAQFAEAGVNTEVVPVEFSTYVSEWDKGEYGFFVFGQTGWPDSADFMTTYWHSEGPRNFINYSNPEVDALLDQANLELDMEKRADLIVQAERIILEEAAYIPYFHDKRAVAFQPWVNGMEDTNVNTGQGHWVIQFDEVWLDPEYQDD